jgi:hypothetical protein
MAILLPEYNRIKDNYCIAYYGHCKDLVLEIKLLLPQMREHYPEINIFISCLDQYSYYFKEENNFIPQSQIQNKKSDLAYIRELKYNDEIHPLYRFLKESEIKIKPVAVVPKPIGKTIGLICQSNSPVKSLSGSEIQKYINYCENKGYKVIINEANNVDWIIGVESAQLIEAAVSGKSVTLIQSGLGTDLLMKMFENLGVLNI